MIKNYIYIIIATLFMYGSVNAATDNSDGGDSLIAYSADELGLHVSDGCEMMYAGSAAEDVDANGEVFLRQYELINEDIMTELTECIIDKLQLDTFDSNIIYMVLSTPNHKAELELKEKGYKYICFSALGEKKLITKKFLFGYISVDKYNIIIIDKIGLKDDEINRLFRKTTRKKRFEVNLKFIPYVGGIDYLYIANSDWKIYPYLYCGE